ncbi:MAG: TRIC cation channel family protein [Solobacterium sp.]|nr:TRIC cation channel family protein [Solobacterium sp.]
MMEEPMILLEVIGTVAFAISGALKALRHKTDLLGVITLGIMTATGGGVLRDLILGDTPPAAFRNPVYLALAAATSLAVFAAAGYMTGHKEIHMSPRYQLMLFVMDSLGLGVFTSYGLLKAWTLFPQNAFLCVFSGVVTGVGGGLIRDISVNELPYIFSKHIYAVAAMAGGIAEMILLNHVSQETAVLCASLIIILIRFVSARYHLNLPRISGFPEQ